MSEKRADTALTQQLLQRELEDAARTSKARDRDRLDLESLNRQQPSRLNSQGLPIVEPPPMFRPGPIVTGTELARDVEALFKIAPQLRGRISKVTSAPTTAAAREMTMDPLLGRDPTDRERSLLLGYFDPAERSIYVKPDEFRGPQSSSTAAGTLAHEAAHAQGFSHQTGVPKRVSHAFEDLRARTKPDINLPLPPRTTR